MRYVAHSPELERLKERRQKKCEKLITLHLLELVRTGRTESGRRKIGWEVPGAGTPSAMYDRAVAEKWNAFPLGADLVAMRPWNGQLPTPAFRNSHRDRHVNASGGRDLVSEWSVSTDFGRKKDEWRQLEAQWCAAVSQATPESLVGKVRDTLRESAKKQSDDFIVRLIAQQAFEALTPESDEWRSPNDEIVEWEEAVREKQAELDREHQQS